MYTIIQFSPTGNAAHIANQLEKKLQGNTSVLALEHTNPLELEKDEHLIIVHAIHAFNAPRTVKRFIKNLPAGLYEKVSLIAVGCNTSWVNNAVSKDIRAMLESKNYKIYVDVVIAMPLTFIMSFPEELIDEQFETATDEIHRISNEIKSSHISHRDIAIKTHVVNFIGRAEPIASRFFGLELHAKKSCTKCGLCVRDCPEKNIRMTKEGKIRFGFKCLMCMRCIYNCPVKAITPRISKFIPISKGYSVNNYINRKL